MKGPVIYYPIAEMYNTTDLSGVKTAKKLRESILEDIDAGLKVELDFDTVRTVNAAFVRNSLGVIVKDYGEEFFRANIRLINYDKVRKSILKGIGDFLEYEAIE